MFSQEAKRIQILNANSIEFDEKIGKDVKRLLGDVQFRHENALMYCDSAYLNSVTNVLQAYSNVHIIQNDSIDLYGDYLKYNGNTKIAKVRKNVKLLHANSQLTTDSLDYDRNTNIAHYFSWGYIKDQQNDLKSINGYYYSDFKDYYAVDSVLLVNPDYTIVSDSLRYNTGSDISYFYGPTDILSDSNLIYCEYGWYDTKQNLTRVSQNSFIQNQEKKISGDSLFYDRNLGFGEAFSNVAVLDTSAKILITGHYANYFEKPDRAFVTDSALMTKYGGGDTLFLHADTLKMFTQIDTLWVEDLSLNDSLLSDTTAFDIAYIYTVPEFNDSLVIETSYVSKASTIHNPVSINVPDTNLKVNQSLVLSNDTAIIDSLTYDDSDLSLTNDTNLTEELSIIEPEIISPILIPVLDTVKIVTAFHHAQIFKTDLQTRSDSLSYSSKDSVIRLFYNPIIWSDNQQVTADYIKLYTENNKPTEMLLQDNAFIALQDDSLRYNQIEGLYMRGYFNKNNELYKLWVDRKAKSIFFPREEATEEEKRDSIKGALVGANVTESANMMIWFKDNQPHKITLYKAPKGVLNPVEYKPIEELKLKGFTWKEYLKPKKLTDIFIWIEEDMPSDDEQKKKK